MTESHSYAHAKQSKAIPALVCVSIIVTYLFTLAQKKYFPDWVPWWLDTPAVLGFYGILFTLFEKYAWSWPGIRSLHGLPNYSGEYKMTLKTSYDNFATERQGTLKISQDWSSVVVRVEMDTSTSGSCGGYLTEVPGEGFRLVYLYHNTPRGQASNTMNQHDGTASLLFAKDGKKATGIYYTGRGRANHGEINIERV